MASIADRVPCPLCGERIVLGKCRIVATAGATTNEEAGFKSEERESKSRSPRPPSGSRVLERVGSWPVIAEAPYTVLQQEYGGLARMLAKTKGLPHPEDLAQIEDLPARLCTECEAPLPAEVESRRMLTIAVVGLAGASKTHYLTSMLRSAYHDQALREPLGCTEFAPDEVTARRFQVDYYGRVFGDGSLHEMTPPPISGNGNRTPLSFRIAFPNVEPMALLFDDVSGEVLSNRYGRNLHAKFLRHADGVIFLVDPTWFPPVFEYLQSVFGVDPGAPSGDQAALIDAVAQEVGRTRDLARLPISVAISKSDLLSGALSGELSFDRPHSPKRDAWMAEMNQISDQVESLLAAELGAASLLAAARRLPNVTFHAVAPLGIQPQVEQKTVSPADVQPQRCLDPLASILARLDLEI